MGFALGGMDRHQQTEAVFLGNAEGDQHVVEHGFGQKYLRHLERTAQTKARNVTRLHAEDAAAIEGD